MSKLTWHLFFDAIFNDIPLEEIVDELKDFDERFRMILSRHLAILGWWCILNLLVAIPGIYLQRNWWWYFFVMNITWAVINLIVVYFLFKHVLFQRYQKGNTYDRFEVQYHVDKMMLLNIGLDPAYVTAGLFLYTLSKLPNINYPEMWFGFGCSVIIQGAFLMIQDHYIYRLHRINFKKAKPYLESLLVNPQPSV